MPQRPSRVIRSSELAARRGGLLHFKAKREELDYIQSGFKDAERVALQVRRQAQQLSDLTAYVDALVALAVAAAAIGDLVDASPTILDIAEGGNDGDLLSTVSGVPAWITTTAFGRALLVLADAAALRGAAALAPSDDATFNTLTVGASTQQVRGPASSGIVDISPGSTSAQAIVRLFRGTSTSDLNAAVAFCNADGTTTAWANFERANGHQFGAPTGGAKGAHSLNAAGGLYDNGSRVALASALASYQPLDSDLTAIAALTTTAYGRAVLELANQAALMALLSSASTTAEGKVELATSAETITGTDTARAVTPAGAAAAYQPLDADLTALAGLASTAGMLSRTGAGAFAARTITGTANEVSVANGTGAAADPTISLPSILALEGKTVRVSDADFNIRDQTDNSKTLRFQAAGISAATTRTLSAPDADGTLALTSDLAAYQPLDADLTALAALTGTATSVPRRTAANTWDQITITTGSWTPTLTNTTNVAASTASVCYYIRVSDQVFFWGNVDIDPTAAGATVMGMSLPIASNFGSASDARGTFTYSGTAVAFIGGGIFSDAANDRLTFQMSVVDTANRNYSFSGGYRII